MHQECVDYCLKVRTLYPAAFESKRVLDLGSWDVNGNNRHLFKNCFYTGVDTQAGDNVDIVALAHELSFAANSFDVVISTEMLEHDPYFYRTLPKAYELLKPKGLLLLTCAGPAREIHGTQAAHPDANLSSNLSLFKDYYRPITPEDLDHILNPGFAFTLFEARLERERQDLYCHGFKR